MKYEIYLEKKLPVRWSRTIPDHHVPYTNSKGNVGYINSYTYESWFAMVKRPYTTYKRRHSPSYRDVRVYTRWVIGDGLKCGFLCFLEDMGERPNNTTLGRIGDIGDYVPGNVVWQTVEQQSMTRKLSRNKKKAA